MFNTLVSMSVFTTICCIYTYVKTKFGKDIYILDKEGKPELLFGEPQLRYSKTTMLSFITFAFFVKLYKNSANVPNFEFGAVQKNANLTMQNCKSKIEIRLWNCIYDNNAYV